MPMCVSTAQARMKSGPRLALFRRSRFTSAPCWFFELCPFCAASVAFSRHFEVQDAVLFDNCRTSDTFSSMWHTQHFLHAAEMLAVMGENEKWVWTSYFVASAVLCRPQQKLAATQETCCMILRRSLSWDLLNIRILLASSKRCLYDLAQVLMRRSCGDPGKFLSKRSLHDPV